MTQDLALPGGGALPVAAASGEGATRGTGAGPALADRANVSLLLDESEFNSKAWFLDEDDDVPTQNMHQRTEIVCGLIAFTVAYHYKFDGPAYRYIDWLMTVPLLTVTCIG